MAVNCELCDAPVARWRNMPGHYRRAHPDVVLPPVIARFGLQCSPRPRPRPRLTGQKTQRALPAPGYRVQPRIQRVRGLSSEGRYVASLPGAVEGLFVSILDNDVPAPVQSAASDIAPVETKTDSFNWIPWVLLAVVGFFFALAPDSGSGEHADSDLISSYTPEGAEQ